jgi:hypothetical protein
MISICSTWEWVRQLTTVKVITLVIGGEMLTLVTVKGGSVIVLIIVLGGCVLTVVTVTTGSVDVEVIV